MISHQAIEKELSKVLQKKEENLKNPKTSSNVKHVDVLNETGCLIRHC